MLTISSLSCEGKKFRWFGRTNRHQKDLLLTNTIIHGRVDGNYRRGGAQNSGRADIQRWIGASVLKSSRAALDRMEWRRRTHCAYTDHDSQSIFFYYKHINQLS